MEEIHHAQDTCEEIDEKIQKLKSIILTIRLMGLMKAEVMARQLKHVTNSLDKIVHYELPIDIDVGFDVFASFRPMPRISTEFRFVDPSDVKKEEDDEEKLCEMGMEILCECKKCQNFFQTIMRYS